MTNFHGIFHGNCAIRYVGEVLKVKKLEFRGLKGQFDVKKIDFRGIIVKIGHCRPILASRTPVCPIVMEYWMGIVP